MNETIKFSELDSIATADDEQYIHVFDTLNNYKLKVGDFNTGGGGSYTEGEGILIDSNKAISASFGTGATNVARGNDSRINNGQTAFSWGDHADAGYTTEQWVQSQNYLTQHQSLAGYATEVWVESKSYLVAADISGKADKATKVQGVGALEGGGDLSVDRTIDLTQDTKDDISLGVTANSWGDHSTEGYATETWVSSQGFSTQTLDNIEDTTEGVKVTGQVQANAIIGMATNSNAAGTYTIDLNNLTENYNLVLTDNTTITFSNMITEDETTVFSLVVTGDHSLSFVGLNLDSNSDIYNGTGKNLIVIHIEKGGASFEGTYTITNL